MKVSDLKINVPETIGENLMLIDEPRKILHYEDGKRTDTLDSIGYTVISPNLSWEKVLVKVKETSPSIEYQGTPIEVKFINLDGKAWQDYRSNTIKLSLTADSIEIVNQKIKMNKGGGD